MRRIVPLVLVVGVCAPLTACGSSSLSARSPKEVRAAIVAAALAQKSVHWEAISRGDMQLPVKFVSDVSADSGTQRLTFDPGTRYVGRAEERLVNGIVYVRGDALGLADVLYLSKAQAKKYTGHWISLQRDDPLYAEKADGLTLSSIVHDVDSFGTPLKLVRRKAHGTPLVVVQADAHSRNFRGLRGSLSAPAHGEPLPVAAWEDNLGYASTSFSKWNEPVNVHAPASSTPIAIVRGSPNAVHAAIVGAALAQKSVRLTATVDRHLYGKRAYTIDVGPDSVAERIKSDGSTMRLLVYDHAIYVRGDAPLLRDRLGLRHGQATRYAGKWIWIPQKGERGLYAQLTDGLTLAALVRRTTGMKDPKLSRGTRGPNVLVVRGTPVNRGLPVDEVRARANGTPLPIAFSGRSLAASASGRFSRWNVPVDIRLPESSTPIAIVRGG